MGQCCATESGKATTDSLAPALQGQVVSRKLESATKTAVKDQLNKASFQTDVSEQEQFTAYSSNQSRTASIKRTLSIDIPMDNHNTDRNPNFRTPLGQDQASDLDDESDAESEMMVMAPSDSVSSMGSAMVRMDSSAALSQASSFSNFGEMNRDPSRALIGAAGAATNFVTVAENDNEDDEESTMQRMESESEMSVMQRVESESEMSVMQRVADDATSMSESVMERVEEDSSVMTGSNASSIAALQVPKELRGLGREQGSTFNLANQSSIANGLNNQVRSTANLASVRM